ncbi:hypothetical protein [Massilia sp. Leaf139]|uniref:hypothetical protein n=1 Tax=Massilia sp. Leaf139 TaxID=1736272 RepID=UPI000AA536BD|nr:hypothetical protein [Massilia sp. Leaf139]
MESGPSSHGTASRGGPAGGASTDGAPTDGASSSGVATRGASSGGVPVYGAARPWTPLVLTLGLHLLLVLAWMIGVRPPAPEAPVRSSTLVFVRSPPLSAPEPVTPLPPPRLRPRQPAAISLPLPEPAPAAAPSLDPEPTESRAESQVESQAASASAEPLPGELLATSKAMAGRIDRDLRKGASPITAEPDRKWERFAEAFAAARSGASREVTLESTTSPDGVTIYRKTVGGKARCYRSGSVGGLVTGFGAADGHGAGATTCPSNVSWTRQ